jgi:hypothetical protein
MSAFTTSATARTLASSGAKPAAIEDLRDPLRPEKLAGLSAMMTWFQQQQMEMLLDL